MKEKKLRGRSDFGKRLLAAREAAGLTQAAVCKALDISQGTLSQLEREALTSRYTTQLANLYGVDPYVLAEGTRPSGARTLDQAVSQGRNYPALPRLKWEEIAMGANLTQPFELEVIDTAFGDDIPLGSMMRLDPALKPLAGRPALVKDRDGNLYLRDYQAGLGGRWRAVARASRGFDPLDSEEHGLEVIAVMRGFDYP